MSEYIRINTSNPPGKIVALEQWTQRVRAMMKDDSIAVETVFNFKPNDSPADTPLTRYCGLVGQRGEYLKVRLT